MAKKAYIGMEDTARKIRRGYIGLNGGLANSIPDGGFSGTSGWTALSLGTFTVSGNTAKTVASANWPQLKTAAIPTIAGHKYYFRYGIKHSGDANTLAQMGQMEIVANSGSSIVAAAGLTGGEWNTFSGIAALQDASCTVVLLLPLTDGSTGAGDAALSVQWKEIMLVDLSAAYGAGHEPDKAWCDANIPFFAEKAVVPFGETSLAHRIKAAYIGIGGLARPCWGNGEVTAFGSVTSLAAARYGITRTANGNGKLLIAGGTTAMAAGGTHYATVDVYDEALTHSTAANRAVSAYRAGAADISGEYALFAGGYNAKNATVYSNVDAYSASLTKSTLTALSVKVQAICGVSVGEHAVFGGGETGTQSSGYTESAVTNAYDGTLTRSILPNLPYAGNWFSAKVGGCGIMTTGGATVVYDGDLTRSSLYGQHSGFGCSCCNWAMFAGGWGGAAAYAYREDLTQTVLDQLSLAQTWPLAAGCGDFAVYACGYVNGSVDNEATAIVEAYDDGVHRIVGYSAASGRYEGFGGSVGNFALFGGGAVGAPGNYNMTATVEAYTVV